MMPALPFVPKYHTQIEHGDFAGCWTPGFFYGGHISFHEAELMAEINNIQKAGGSVVYFNFKADLVLEEALKRLDESMRPTPIIDEKFASQLLLQRPET